jgi:hypothetical protein
MLLTLLFRVSSAYIITSERCRALVVGLFFRHQLCVRGSSPLALAGYMRCFLRDCLLRFPRFTQLSVRSHLRTRHQFLALEFTKSSMASRVIMLPWFSMTVANRHPSFDSRNFHCGEDHIITLAGPCASVRLNLRACALIVEPSPVLGAWMLIAQSIRLFDFRDCPSGLRCSADSYKGFPAVHMVYSRLKQKS